MLDLTKVNIKNFNYHQELTSTNDEALNLAKNQAAEFTTVFAEVQTKGRGRFERVWQTYPYKSLAFSFVLYDFDELIPLVLCCSLYKILSKKYNAEVAIKWPNDIYFKDKKLSGILVESYNINNSRVYIVGIGLNIFKQDDALDTVGFLENYTDQTICRETLLSEVFEQIQQDIASLKQNGFAQFKDYFMQNCMYLNQNIKVNVFDKVHEGEFQGINNQGYLILKQKEVILNIPAGQIVQSK